MRCDLHVHSWYSGRAEVPLLEHVGRECYSDPLDVGAAGMAPIGGSDAHCLAHVARAFTKVPGARTKEEFLDGLRSGLTVPRGRSGRYARLTSEGTRIFAAGYLETLKEAAEGTLTPLRAAPAPAALGEAT